MVESSESALYIAGNLVGVDVDTLTDAGVSAVKGVRSYLPFVPKAAYRTSEVAQVIYSNSRKEVSSLAELGAGIYREPDYDYEHDYEHEKPDI